MLLKKFRMLFMCVLLACMLFPMSVSAHANLLSSSPKNDEVLSESPDRIVLNFSEPLELETSAIQLLDSKGKKVDLIDVKLAPGNAKQMVATLPALTEGSYMVSWSLLSEDGHPVSESFVFSVGNKTAFSTSPNQAGAHSMMDPFIPFFRFFVEGMTLICGGLFWFSHMAKRRGLPGYQNVIEKYQTYGVLALAIGSIIMLIAYAAILPEGLLSSIVVEGKWHLVRQVPFAVMIIVQTLLLLLLLLSRMVDAWYLMIWALLICIPATAGHIWGIEPVWSAFASRGFHRAALALWLGALTYLLLCIAAKASNNQAIDWAKLRPFFIRVVVASVVVLIVSGLLMVNLQTDLATLLKRMTPWSFVLIIKIGLLFSMLLFALRQTLQWRREGKLTSVYLLGWELSIGLLALLAGILMSQSSYPTP